MMSENRGSEWKRWDLHVHSPTSFMRTGHPNWENYISALESAPEEVKAIAITDYGTIEGYKKVKEYRDQGRLSNIDLILPNIELRIQSPQGTSTSSRGVDIHLIFNSDHDEHIEQIERCMTKLKHNAFETDYGCHIDEFKRLGKSINNDISDEEAIKEGYNNFRPDINTYIKWRDSEEWLKNNCIIGICNRNNSELANIDGYKNIARQIRQFADIIFSGNPADINYFLGKKDGHPPTKVIRDIGSLKPCIHGCDKHKAEELFNVENERYCWIKADRTFEGLKQIIYDPEFRVYIGSQPLRKPINTIDSIKVNFPINAKLGEQRFCYADVEKTLLFSPYFNCVIGGRGSGKSTLLNLLGVHSNNSISSKLFWGKLDPNFEIEKSESFLLDEEGGNKSNSGIDKGLSFSFKGTNEFELLAQSEIESFAKDMNAFTQAIYQRARAFSGGEKLKKITDDIAEQQRIIKNTIHTITDVVNLRNKKSKKEKTKESYEKVIRTLKSTEYIKLERIIRSDVQKYNAFKISEKRVSALRERLSNLLTFLDESPLLPQPPANSYDEAYVKAVDEIRQVAKMLDVDNSAFQENNDEQSMLANDIKEKQSELGNMVRDLGYEAESIEQFKNAPDAIINMQDDIAHYEESIKQLMRRISESDDIIRYLNEKKKLFEEQLDKSLESLKDLLRENKGDDVKRISIEYEFDFNRAWKELSKEFIGLFDNENDSVRYGYCIKFICEHNGHFNYSGRKKRQQIESLLSKASEETNSAHYILFLQDIFSKDYNYRKFELIRDMHLTDVNEYKTIRVSYDKLDISKASFGQRCTAVIVIMMLFGNRPLIIDEPEAHLDSSLIANYLVPLIKRKKLDRQIIFATHNANFVINGDAEKIFILENETGKTDIAESTIENLEYRQSLLKLEGGKEAFKKRGIKLAIDPRNRP